MQSKGTVQNCIEVEAQTGAAPQHTTKDIGYNEKISYASFEVNKALNTCIIWKYGYYTDEKDKYLKRHKSFRNNPALEEQSRRVNCYNITWAWVHWLKLLSNEIYIYSVQVPYS